MITLTYQRFKGVITFIWKPPTINWAKVNSNGFALGLHASCRGIFCDHRSTPMGCFASNLGVMAFFEAKITGFILAMEFALQFA